MKSCFLIEDLVNYLMLDARPVSMNKERFDTGNKNFKINCLKYNLETMLHILSRIQEEIKSSSFLEAINVLILGKEKVIFNYYCFSCSLLFDVKRNYKIKNIDFVNSYFYF